MAGTVNGKVSTYKALPPVSAISPSGLQINTSAIIAGASGQSRIFFGDYIDENAGVIEYDHASNYMAFRTNGSGEDVRIDSSGDVAIGTTTATYRLTVEDSSADWASRIYNTGTGASNQGLLVRTDATAVNNASAFAVYAGSNYRLMVKSGGNVGINETDPTLGSGSTGLHVTGTQHARIKIESGADDESSIQFTENGTDQWRIEYDAVDDHLEFTESGVAVRMVIEDGGNVGIGTTAPDNQLFVAATATGGYVANTDTTWNGITIRQTLSHSASAAGLKFETTSTTQNGVAAIVAERVTTDKANLNFLVSDDNGSTYTEALILDGSGVAIFNETIRANSVGGAPIEIQNGSAVTLGRITHDSSGTGHIKMRGDSGKGLKLGSNGSDVVTINTSGNFGIDETSPSYKLHVKGDAAIQQGSIALRVGADSGGTTVTNSTQKIGRVATPHYTNAEEPMAIVMGIADSSENKVDIGGNSSLMNTATRIAFFTAANTTTVSGSERMRITSDGDVLIGTTSISITGQSSNSGVRMGDGFIQAARGNDTQLYLNRLTSDGDTALFQKNGTSVGSISVTGSATAYNTSSDYRLKENVAAITGATERLKQLNPVRFNFIADPDKTVDGFLAHEVSDYVPEAVKGEKDAVDADGNPEYQGIDQSKLVPLLVATIKELEARITALES